MPDFGYGQDNYLLSKGDIESSRWKTLTGLLGDN